MISYLLILSAIVASGGAFVILGFSVYMHLVVIFLCVIKLFLSKSILISKRSLIIFLSMMALFLILMVLRGENFSFSDNASVLARMCIALLMCIAFESDGVKAVVARFLSTFEAICIIGLFSWVAFNVPVLRDLVSIKLNIMAGHGGYQEAFQCDINYKTILFMAFSRNCDFEKYGFVRNHCLFWEPGVLSYFVSFFYMIKTLYLNDRRRDGIYFMTILSTFSLGGIAIFLTFYVSNWFFKHFYSPVNRKSNFLSFLLILFLVSILVFLATNIESFLGVVGSLFGRQLSTDSSAQLRFFDFYYGIKAALDNPWLGSGRDFHLYNDYLLDNAGVSKSAYEGGMTNAVVSLFYRYGAFFWSFYMISLYIFSRSISRQGALMVFMFLLLMLMHEPLDTCIVMLFFIFFMRLDAVREGKTAS